MTTLIQPPSKEPTTNAEIELLLCCVRTCITPQTAEQIKTLVQQNINWTDLMQTAALQGVIPLLYQTLNTTCPEDVPKTILAQLRSQFHANALRNLLLTQELLTLLALFNKYDICAIPFKGPVLAVEAYGNLALRQFGDLDILVRKQDYTKAKELLITQGYCMLHDSQHEAKYLQAQLCHSQRQVSVDLHYGIPPWELELETAGFWENLQPVSLTSTTILTLSPEDHLLILCINGHKVFWRHLGDICNVAAMICTHPEMNWQRIIEQAQRLRIKRILYVALVLASDVLKIPLPEEILSTVKTAPFIRWLAIKLHENCLFKTEDFNHYSSSDPRFNLTIGLYNLLISKYKYKNVFNWLRLTRLIRKYGFAYLKYMFKQLHQT
ncbi:nucleotidyltransferase family protein [Nostoc sp. CENA67]|uniref:Nucleotidyltransferase family protein n=1 Tax=Amazonocrinis nigriterrae CENA67 TaxID=2794033 RepID=A0A8J7HM91_9NOST|nr:nucleotidyltransferase family protein [Amazonocrinis nigriterrae]MBH8562241.1 nucleotidyltransferase family protein [Amazonocrinis nigriterrae CENA67]